jgi:hypothetical protein
LILVPVNVIFFAAYLLFQEFSISFESRNSMLNELNQYIGYVLYFMFFLLLVCVIRLIRLLKKMRDHLYVNETEQKDFFNKEIRTLWVILIVFNSTYLLRGLWD